MDIKQLLKDVAKKYGEGSAMLYADLDRVQVQRISTGIPSLDLALGGGIPEGRIIEIYWPNSSGKTSLAIKFLAEVQKKYPEKRVAFIDVEHALDPEYAGVLGLKMDELILCQPNSAEEALGIMEMLCASGEVKAVILDSVAKLTPRKELDGDIGDAEMGMRARLMSQALRKITPKASDNKCTCFFINQVRTNLGQMYGNPEVRPGGNALPFDASVIIRTSSKQIDEKTGETTMVVKKNKVWKPFRSTKVIIEYWKGFNYIQDLITTAIEIGVITRAGAFYSFGSDKRQGEEKMRVDIGADEKLQKIIEKAIASNPVNEPIIQEKKGKKPVDVE